jgi:hypothetical protein
MDGERKATERFFRMTVWPFERSRELFERAIGFPQLLQPTALAVSRMRTGSGVRFALLKDGRLCP